MKIFYFIFAFLMFAMPVASAQDTPHAYKGYACTKDCSGHKAGYAWAQKKGVTSRDQCGGSSRSFIEGCLSWVEEQAGGDPPPEAEDDPDDEIESLDP